MRRGSSGAAESPVLVVPFVLDGEEHVLIGLHNASALDRTENALSPAEREVACAALRGASNAQIALARGVSPRTVANQLASVFRKLDVSSRAGLASRLSRSK